MMKMMMMMMIMLILNCKTLKTKTININFKFLLFYKKYYFILASSALNSNPKSQFLVKLRYFFHLFLILFIVFLTYNIELVYLFLHNMHA